MKKELPRKQFIKMAALGSVGLYLSSCHSSTPAKTTQKVNPAKDTIPKPTAIVKSTTSDVILYKKGDALYDQLRNGFNKRINKFPAVIALCKTTEGVVTALDHARKNGLPVAIKSGGHCMEGFSVNDGGMAINLSEINGVEKVNDNLFKVGPGTVLMQLYNAVLPQQRIVPAGACGMVGIGGLALGGGYGFFSRHYGLACDQLMELTMADAKGNIHTAKDNDELLWACRGGGNGNFGVITSMTFRSHPLPPQFQSHRFRAFNVDTTKTLKIMEKWFELGADLPVSCFSAFVLNHTTAYVLLTNYGEHTPQVQNFIDAITALTDKASNGQPIETAKAVKTFYGSLVPVTFRNSCAGLYNSFAELSGFISSVIEKVSSTPGMIYQVNTLGGNIANKDFEAASAYPHRSKKFVSELQTYWEQPGQAEKLTQAFADVQNVFASNGIIAQYCNYPYLGFTNWQQAYYGDNYARLQAVKNMYDPDNLIRHEQSVRNKI